MKLIIGTALCKGQNWNCTTIDDNVLSPRQVAIYWQHCKKNKIKPYKPKNLHILEPEDEERRILFMVPKWISK